MGVRMEGTGAGLQGAGWLSVGRSFRPWGGMTRPPELHPGDGEGALEGGVSWPTWTRAPLSEGWCSSWVWGALAPGHDATRRGSGCR